MSKNTAVLGPLETGEIVIFTASVAGTVPLLNQSKPQLPSALN